MPKTSFPDAVAVSMAAPSRQDFEANAAVSWIMNSVDGVTEVTPESVGFPDEEGVVLAECLQARRQVRTVVLLPGRVILLDAPRLDSGDHECILLKIGAL